MQTLERKQIKKGLHPFWKEDKNNLFSEAQAQARRILKYAPKCIELLELHHWKNAKLVNALKRVKKVDFVSDLRDWNSPPNQFRLVLQNKFKSVLRFDGCKSFKDYKPFSKVTQASLQGSPSFQKNFLRFLPGMTHLKAFNVYIGNDTHPDTFKKINSLPKILSSLKTLKFRWFSYRYCPPEALFSSFVKNPNILEFVTHLTITNPNEGKVLENFEQLYRNCKRLIFLWLDPRPESVDINIWKSLKNFENLECIKVDSKDLFSYFDDYAFPPSIKNIQLRSTSWEELGEDMLAKLMNFSEKWSNLHHLTSLTLDLKTRGTPKSVLNLVHFVLQNVPISLVDFEFTLNGNNHDSLQSSIDLTNILGALQRFGNKLQTLCLNLPNFDLLAPISKQDLTFNKLTKFSLSVKSFSDVGMAQNIIKENAEISLSNYIVDSNQALLDILLILQKPPRNSKISFKTVIKKLDSNEFDELFQKLETKEMVKNVSLIVDWQWGSCDEKVQSRLNFFLYGMFEDVDFRDNRGFVCGTGLLGF